MYTVTSQKELKNLVTPKAINNYSGTTVFRLISESLEVNVGNDNDCNVEYCKEHKIPVYNTTYRCGGTIVLSNGTIAYGVLYDAKEGWKNVKFLTAFCEFLREKGFNPIVSKNDILIAGHKVASSSEMKLGNGLSKMAGVYLISYDLDIGAIEHICKKRRVKRPIALKDFNKMTKEEIIAWGDNFFGSLDK